jgi:sec-independent protein translocase protein TatA
MNVGPWQLIIIALVILVLFGRGRISEMMGDFGKGIKSFKKGMNEEETPATPPAQIGQQASSSPDAAQVSPSAESGKASGGN